MRRNFWTRLFLPLVFIFALSLIIHVTWEADGFFINLSTEIIGILLTVFYVDWIIQQHEKQKWQSTDKKINERLITLLNSIVTHIRVGLKIDFDILDEQRVFDKNLMVAHKEVMRVAKDVIYPVVFQKIKGLDEKAWKSLYLESRESYNSVLSFFNTFQGRLSPDQITALLDLQESLSKALTFYTVFFDLAGVPVDQLPETRTPPEVLQMSGYKSTAMELENAITLMLKLSDSVSME